MTCAVEATEINGIVVDGLVRDKQKLQDLRFTVFSKGFTSDGPHKTAQGK
ncbi:hypothetical protein [Salibacterium halotolerans]